MELTDVQKQMVPGAEAAIGKVLDYHEATKAFQFALIHTAVKLAEGDMARAGRKLSVSYTQIYNTMNGLNRPRRKFRTSAKQVG